MGVCMGVCMCVCMCARVCVGCVRGVCACVCGWLSTSSLRSSEQRSARRLRQALMPADRAGSSVAVRMSSFSVMNLGCEGTHLRGRVVREWGG